MSIRTYLEAEDGAVTVDWVLVTAAMIGLSLGLMALLADPFRQQTTALQTYLSRDDLICTNFCIRSATEDDGDADL